MLKNQFRFCEKISVIDSGFLPKNALQQPLSFTLSSQVVS